MKSSITLLTCILLATTSIAQNDRTSFGIKGGLNVSNISVKDAEDDFKARLSFHLGVLAHVHLMQSLAVQPELVFSGQGAKTDFGSDDVKLNLGYLNIPVLLQYMMANGLRLQTGPQFGYLLTAKSKLDDFEEDVKDDLNGIDFGWVIGGGFLTPSGFGVDLRYNLGISNINDEGGSKLRNRVFQLGVFYQFQRMNR
jgi:hypothetical protein